MKLDLFLSSLPSLLHLVVAQPLLSSSLIFRRERDPGFSISMKLSNNNDLFHRREFRQDFVELWVDLMSLASVSIGVGSKQDFRLNLE
jgi:hypothetical protein